MTSKKNIPNALVRSCIAAILCFLAAYLSEKTLGFIAAIPFILILPGLAGLIYPRLLHITAFCALGAFIFKSVFSSDMHEIILSTVLTAVFGAVSAYTFARLCEIKDKEKRGKRHIAAIVLFIAATAIYIFSYGTVTGNLASKSINEEYLKKTYPEEELLIGSTYYDASCGYYVTEFGFTMKERYSGLVGAAVTDKDGYAIIDGYRDRIKYEMLEKGKSNITTALSTFAYLGTDYVIRNNSLDTKDKLYALSEYSEYADKTSYEIALYYSFDSKKAFEDMCREYTEHLSKYDSVKYGSITFYGFGSSDKKDFSYTLTHEYGTDMLMAKDFDSSSYSRYFDEKDTHKYWELLG